MMAHMLIASILVIGVLFLLLTAVIIAGKVWREAREGRHRRRRRVLEPKVLAYAHSDRPSLVAELGGRVRAADRRVLEAILLDHVQRVKGIERERLCAAIDECGYVERYLKALKSGRWWARAKAGENLGLSGASRATEALVRALEDPVYEVRLRAAKALGLVGGKTAVLPLIQALSEPDRWSTIRVADVLSGMGGAVIGELLRVFPSLNHHGKVAVLDIIGRVRPIEVEPWLAERLRDPEGDVRARACHAMGAIGDPDAGPALAQALGDTEWPVRAMAAKALGRIRFSQAIPRLCVALRDRAWWVRANAAEALRLMGPPGAEALERMLDDEDTYARHQAVIMLQESGVLDRHVAALASSGGPARELAERTVKRFIGAGQIGRLRELSETHADAAVRRALAALLPKAIVPGEASR